MPGIFGLVEISREPIANRRHELVDAVRRMAAAMLLDERCTIATILEPELGVCAGRVGLGPSLEWAPDAVHGDLMLLTAGEPRTGAPSEALSTLRMACSGSGSRELIAAYLRDGERALCGVGGAFAGILVDRRRRSCVLFNDRYGMERLFVHRDGPRTYFASEAKAILAVASGTRAFDQRGLTELLACGATLGDRSLYRGIEVLPGATVVRFDASGVERARYFESAAWESEEPVSNREFVEAFSSSLRCAVRDAIHRPVRAGISLTAGLDSRMIMSSLAEPPESVPCYTFGSMYRESLDVVGGREVAGRCRQPHQVLVLGAAFLQEFQRNFEAAVYTSDGYLGLSGAAELYVNRLARSIAPARITGNWGGEVLRGVRAFKWRRPRGNFLGPELRRSIEDPPAAFSAPEVIHPVSFALFQQVPMQGYGRYAIERSQVMMRAPFLDLDVVRWAYRAPAAVRESLDTAIAVIGDRHDLLETPTDFGLLGRGPSAARLLRRVWRRGLARAEYATSHGAPHWVARIGARLPASMLEYRFLGHHKFQHFRVWLRRELAGYAREVLLGECGGALASWFDLARVRVMLDEHVAGRANYTEELDQLMTLAVAHRVLLNIDSAASPALVAPAACATCVVS
jgi:asparagine synthase (glutamine-hydrolysing)